MNKHARLPPPSNNRDQNSLYEADLHAWTVAQSGRLRRELKDGTLPSQLDWTNIIEELEALGRSERDAVESHLIIAFEHLVKLAAWPDHEAGRQWANSVRHTLRSVARKESPSLRGMLDDTRLQGLYSDGRDDADLERTDMGTEPRPVRIELPPAITRELLLDRRWDAESIRRLSDMLVAGADPIPVIVD